jgi:hypothetical protein
MFGSPAGRCGNPTLDGSLSGLAGRIRASADSVGGVTATASGFVTAVASHFRRTDGNP